MFSPSFWVSREVEDLVSQIRKDSRIYMSVGSEEGGNMVSLMNSMAGRLTEYGMDESQLYSKVVEGMGHNEKLWTMEFAIAYEWMFGQ